MTRHDEFLNPSCRPGTLRLYVQRRALLKAVRGAMAELSGVLLDVGSGYQPYRPLITGPGSRVTRYLPVDLPGTVYGRPEVAWDGLRLPLADEAVDSAMATEVLEHCPDPAAVVAEVHRVLRPGGVFFFTVPFLWPLHCVPHDEARPTPFALERHLRAAGFERVELRAMGGYHAALAQMLALWAARPGQPRALKAFWTTLLLPPVAFLRRLDRPPARFGENQMITGVSGLAFKKARGV